MAYSVDWIAKVFTIPQSDLTFLDGNNYLLNVTDVHEELRRLEWAFLDGLWAQQIAKFYETVTLSGIPKSPSLEIINGYTFNFTGSNYNVVVDGFDTNLFDVYLPANGVSMLAINSVGRQTITTGSGLDSGQDAKLTNVNDQLLNIEGGMNHDQLMRLLLASLTNKLSGANTTEITIRDFDNLKDRIVATVDEFGNRTPTLIDPD